MELSVLVALCCWVAPALGSAFGREMQAPWEKAGRKEELSASTMDKAYDDSPFNYDYESLRIGGLVFAVVLFVMGIALIVSRKCTCSSDKPKPMVPELPDAEAGVPKAE